MYSRTLTLEILILEDGIDKERPYTFLRILCPSLSFAIGIMHAFMYRALILCLLQMSLV